MRPSQFVTARHEICPARRSAAEILVRRDWAAEDFVTLQNMVCLFAKLLTWHQPYDRAKEFDRFFAGNIKREGGLSRQGLCYCRRCHPKHLEISGAETPVLCGVGKSLSPCVMANTVRRQNWAARHRRIAVEAVSLLIYIEGKHRRRAWSDWRMGSGKSTIAAMFAARGVHRLDVTRWPRVDAAGRPVYAVILQHFSALPDAPTLLLPNRQLDRVALARTSWT